MPPHIRRGLIRLYLILLIPWVTWNGYNAYEANKSIRYAETRLDEFYRLSSILDDPTTSTAQIAYARRELGFMALSRGLSHATNDDIENAFREILDYGRDRLTTAVYAVLAAVMVPLLYPIALWIVAGFRKAAPVTIEPRSIRGGNPPSTVRRGSPKPSMMDAFIKLAYGSSPPKTAKLQEAIELCYAQLLGRIVDIAQVRSIATQLYDSPIPYSTHDLAVATALNLFRSGSDGPRREQFAQIQIFVRMVVLDWMKEGKVVPMLAKSFEDTLYERYKPGL